ncbi:unnamed protein product, partial [Owenia fusiformis]
MMTKILFILNGSLTPSIDATQFTIRNGTLRLPRKDPNLQRLNLGGKGISEIEAGEFAGFNSLEELSLNNNNLSEIEDGPFAGLVSLELLNLGNNRLSEITCSDFSDFHGSLKKLDLTYNRLTKPRGNHFCNLTYLE